MQAQLLRLKALPRSVSVHEYSDNGTHGTIENKNFLST